MPEICRFEGIIIRMMFNDNEGHHKPHVHIIYGEYIASIGIDGELLAGNLPVRQLKIVKGWLALYEDELYEAWNLAVRGMNFNKIPPLK